MVEADLDAHVKEHFGMDLHGFVRKKIEEEGVWDYEVADMLNVKHSQIGVLRYRLGIDRKKGFFGRFERKYGFGAVGRFKEMIEKQEKSLTDVGNYFGFSREYARQVYWKIYGCSYGESFRKKKVSRKKRPVEPKQPEKLVKVRNKMASLGFHPKIENEGRTFRILANGYRLGFKFSERPRLVGTHYYFSINYKGCFNTEACDFFICLLKRKRDETHYIIPQDAMPRCSIALSPEADEAKSKYSQFKEAWHLLEKGAVTRVRSS